MRTIMIAMVCVFALSGCGHNAWTKPGATKDDLDAQSRACEDQALHIDQDNQRPMGDVDIREYVNHCLREAGWTLGPEK